MSTIVLYLNVVKSGRIADHKGGGMEDHLGLRVRYRY